MVGPTDDGRFLELKVCSIQRNRSACRVLRAGQAATLALGDFDRALLRKVSGVVRQEGTERKALWVDSDRTIGEVLSKAAMFGDSLCAVLFSS